MKHPSEYAVGDTVAYGYNGFVVAKVIRLTTCHAVLDNGHRFHRKSGFVIGGGRRVMDYSDPNVQERIAEGRMNPKYVKDGQA